MDLSWQKRSDAVKLIARGATIPATWRIALVVGTILSIANQATNLADHAGQWDTWLRVGFNYLVPYVVASTGYLAAYREHEPQGIGDELGSGHPQDPVPDDG